MTSSTSGAIGALPHTPSWPTLVLGSTSPYRRELLSRLGLPFEVCAPGVNEACLPGEGPHDTALRLAREKAAGVAAQRADSDVLVIGSDQVAELAGQVLGKPGTHERARAQLQAMRGQTVRFHTAVCVMRPQSGFAQSEVSTVTVRFRDLSDADIQTYLQAEQPYDCAGSAKVESLGIVLLGCVESLDPTALIGLPLISTTRMMREAGADPLAWRASLSVAGRDACTAAP